VSINQLRNDPVAWPILEERARRLAIQAATASTIQGEEILIFRLGDSGYSLPARLIREVQPFSSYTALPATPAYIVGLVNLRGRLLTVLDLRPLLGSPVVAPQPGAALLVVVANGVDIGLLADVVVEVCQSTDELAAIPVSTADHSVAWVCGVDRQLNLRIDPSLLLADPRLMINAGPQ
jgi:purine-binding chemotaxis protein CheW